MTQPKPTTYADAVDLMLEMLETDERKSYIAGVRTLIIKSRLPDWNGKDNHEAIARLASDLMPYLYPALPFSTTELTTGDYYALWAGLAEHLLVTVDQAG
ncbi:MAG: hypothetical protein KUF74_11455 [Candidatus Thiodiazotropha sp. (ex Ctena orbiculata)]|nr:hypothetical protein [Candidatus Thiodiazotropha taylori]